MKKLFLLSFIAFSLLFFMIWLNSTFFNVSLESIIYFLKTNKVDKSSIQMYGFFWHIFGYAFFATLLYCIVCKLLKKGAYQKLKKNSLFISIFLTCITIICFIKIVMFIPTYLQNTSMYLLLTGILMILFAISFQKNILKNLFYTLPIFLIICIVSFLFNQFNIANLFSTDAGTFYEDNFVLLNKEIIKEPKQKRNLIIVSLESVEKTFADTAYFKKSLIPGLEQLTKENISFANYKQGYAQDWTQASFFAWMVGAPLNNFLFLDSFDEYNNKYDGDTTSMSNYSNHQNILQLKAPSLTRILKSYNYNTLFVKSGKLTFANNNIFLKDNLFDQNRVFGAEEIQKITPNAVYENMGVKDKYAYPIFKKQILDLPKDNPFIAVMFSVDTHFARKLEPEEQQKSKEAIQEADTLIIDFVNWVKKQDFADNTTLVIFGDHLRMGTDLDELQKSGDNRSIYNVFINSVKSPQSTNKTFTATDLFPTLLESIGFEIKGHKLGLGTSLFSNQQTLIEKFGFKNLQKELEKKSHFYQGLFRQ